MGVGGFFSKFKDRCNPIYNKFNKSKILEKIQKILTPSNQPPIKTRGRILRSIVDDINPTMNSLFT